MMWKNALTPSTPGTLHGFGKTDGLGGTARSGVGVIVGEWGAYNKTTHAVTLRWMEDMLRTFQRAGIG